MCRQPLPCRAASALHLWSWSLYQLRAKILILVPAAPEFLLAHAGKSGGISTSAYGDVEFGAQDIGAGASSDTVGNALIGGGLDIGSSFRQPTPQATWSNTDRPNLSTQATKPDIIKSS